MRKYLFVSAILACFFVCGCGHNTVSYGDGIMLETTINPETYAFGVSLRYGKILTACVRENTKVKMTGEGKGSGDATGNTTGANAQGSVEIEIGKQITGYYVDAIKAGVKAEDLQKYVDSGDVPVAGGNDTEKSASAPKTPENAK